MNPTLAAAAWVLLSGGPAPVAIPAPTTPAPPVLDCQRPVSGHFDPHRLAATRPGHLTVRWVGSDHHHRHHHRRRERFEDQP